MNKVKRIRLYATLALWSCTSLFTLAAHGQECSTSIFTGDKAVYGSGPSITNAHEYIDASQLVAGGASSVDVCYAIKQGLAELTNYNQSCSTALLGKSGVIDARGIVPPSGSSPRQWDCSVNPFSSGAAWAAGANVTVLLPPGTIGSTSQHAGVASTWILPTNTHLVGEGAAGPSATTLSFNFGTSGGTMIQMGPSFTPPGCPNAAGVILEHLALSNASTSGTVNGINNIDAQELNYVTDIALNGISGTGLQITGQNDSSLGCANNSGPISKVYFSGSGTCVNINGTNGTRGIHGLNCVGAGQAGPAIKIDGRNNTIQDVSISGYSGGDGVVIGSQGNYAQNNIILNLAASGVANAVHISNASTPAPTDTTLMGISGGTTVVQDDVTSATITSSPVAIYVLGEKMVTSHIYSRFTTSNVSTPTWFVGTTTTPSSDTCSVNGSLYSVTKSGSTAPTLFGCVNGVWTGLSGSN